MSSARCLARAGQRAQPTNLFVVVVVWRAGLFRQAIRDTWFKLLPAVVTRQHLVLRFVVGWADSGESNMTDYRLAEREAGLVAEQGANGDMVRTPVIDSYDNLIYKVRPATASAGRSPTGTAVYGHCCLRARLFTVATLPAKPARPPARPPLPTSVPAPSALSGPALSLDYTCIATGDPPP